MEQQELIGKIEDAMGRVADQTKATPDSQKAVHYSQAVLNLSHARVLNLTREKNIADPAKGAVQQKK